MKRLVLAGAAAALACGAALWVEAQESPTLTSPRSGLGDRITNLRSRLWGDKNNAGEKNAPAANASPEATAEPGQSPSGGPNGAPPANPGNAAPPMGVERLPVDGTAPPLPTSARVNPQGNGYTPPGGAPPRMAAVPEPGSSRRRPDPDAAAAPEMKSLGEQPRQNFTPPTSGPRPGFAGPNYSAPATGSNDSAPEDSASNGDVGEASVSSDPRPASPSPLAPISRTPLPGGPLSTPPATTPAPSSPPSAPATPRPSLAPNPSAAPGPLTAAAPVSPPSPGPSAPSAPSGTSPAASSPLSAPPTAATSPSGSPFARPAAPGYLPPADNASPLAQKPATPSASAPANAGSTGPAATVNRSRLAAEMERLQQRLPPAEETPPATATRTNDEDSLFSGADSGAPADDGSAALKSLEESIAPAMEPADEDPGLQPAPTRREGFESPFNDGSREPIPGVTPEATPRPEAPLARPEPPRARLGSVGNTTGRAGDGRVLSSRQTPILVIDTVGPSRIVIGKEATYSVILRNDGASAAKDVVVNVKVPDWAEIVGCEAKASGFVSRGQGERADSVVWTLGRVEPQQHEELLVRVLPKQGLPFELSVQVSHSPVASQASVEVAEPKLTMSLSGPSEVLFGKQELFRLVLSNPGTADAENVQLRLYAANPGEAPPPAHEVGTVPAGDKKIIELELTAREGGTLKIHATATASGGLSAEANESVLVRKPDLRIATRGPKFRYSGTPGTYEIVVANPGNADARNVQIVALVPPGAKYVECSDRGQYDAERGKVSWKLSNLPAGGESVLTWKCELGEAGQTRFQAACVADGGLKDSTSTITQVEAIADLVVTVADPRGPIPVGEEMTYQVKIANRGTRRADNVSVAGYFPTGLKGVASDEGHGYRVSQGFVQFESLPTVAPGQEIVLAVKAVASTPGNHVFKAELRCDALNTRIAVEENTMFYSDEDGAAAQAPAPSTPSTLDSASAPSPNERAITAPPTPRTAGRLRLP